MDTSESAEGTTSPQPDLQRPSNDEARDNEESTTSRSQPSQGEPDEEYTDYISGESVKFPKHWSWTWMYNGHRWAPRAKISTAEAYQELQMQTAGMAPEEACAFIQSYDAHENNCRWLVKKICTRAAIVMPYLYDILCQRTPFNMAEDDTDRIVLTLARMSLMGTIDLLKHLQRAEVEEVNSIFNPEGWKREAGSEESNDEDEDDCCPLKEMILMSNTVSEG